jgi:hypothetical protein
MKMLNLIKIIEIYQNFEMDEIHVTLKKLNMDEIGPHVKHHAIKVNFIIQIQQF